MTETYRVIPVTVGNATIYVEAREVDDDGTPQKVAVGDVVEALPFESISNAIESIGQELAATLSRVSPTKASVELGLEIGVEAGQLVALVAKGTAKANLKVTLEWTRPSA